MSNEEIHMEISYLRRYVTGQYQHKEYSVKIGGSEQQLREQVTSKQAAIAELVASMEGIVVLANKAAQEGKKVSEIVEETFSEPKVTQASPAAPAVKPAKKSTKDEDDIF